MSRPTEVDGVGGRDNQIFDQVIHHNQMSG